MHDIDRVRLEAETFETGAFGNAPQAFNGRAEVFGETENMELASELLEVSSEQEMEQFLGDLVAKAGQSIGQFFRSEDGRALANVLKGAARRVLPKLGASAGRYLAGDTGAQLGAQAASAAGRAFGLELEGLSNEDREFEVARRFVDFAGEAARNLATCASQDGSPGRASPMKQAVAAAMAAARTHAPGLVQMPSQPSRTPSSAGPPTSAPPGASSGRWVRRGSKIILFGT